MCGRRGVRLVGYGGGTERREVGFVWGWLGSKKGEGVACGENNAKGGEKVAVA